MRNAAFILVGMIISHGCGGEGTNGSPKTPQIALKLGGVLARTGPTSNPNWELAATLATNDMNAALAQTKNNNLKFDVPISDSAGDPVVTVMRARELLAAGAKGLLLDGSEPTIATNMLNYDLDPAKRINITLVCQSCGSGTMNNPEAADANPVRQATLRDGDRWLFKSMMDQGVQTIGVARLFLSRGTGGDVNGDGKVKVAVFSNDETFGRSTVSGLKSAFATLGASTVIVDSVLFPPSADPNAYDYGSDIAKLVDNQTVTPNGLVEDVLPDAIFEGATVTYGVGFTRAYRLSNLKIPLYHSNSFRRLPAIQSLGSQGNGEEGMSTVIHDNTPSGQNFANAFKKISNSQLFTHDPSAYDGMAMLMLATLIASKDLADPTAVTSAAIRDALLTVNAEAGMKVGTGPAEFVRGINAIAAGQPINYEGAVGNCDFDQNRKTRTKMARWRIEQQVFQDVEYFDCVSDASCPPIK